MFLCTNSILSEFMRQGKGGDGETGRVGDGEREKSQGFHVSGVRCQGVKTNGVLSKIPLYAGECWSNGFSGFHHSDLCIW